LLLVELFQVQLHYRALKSARPRLIISGIVTSVKVKEGIDFDQVLHGKVCGSK
jgi:hypothetical protein